jgi:hypothetical protein
MFVTVTVPPRKRVEYARGAFGDAAWTTDNFQNGLLVSTSTKIPFVLLDAANVNGSPFGEVAVTGRIRDLAAGMLTLAIGSMIGVAEADSDKAHAVQKSQERIIWAKQYQIPGNARLNFES